MIGVLVGCAVCFGSTHSGVQLVMLGLLLLPFLMVGGMMGLLYLKGAFATRSPEAAAVPGTSPPASRGDR